MGAEGDSFYEYLVKAYVQSGKRDYQAKDMYDQSVAGTKKWLLKYVFLIQFFGFIDIDFQGCRRHKILF